MQHFHFLRTVDVQNVRLDCLEKRAHVASARPRVIITWFEWVEYVQYLSKFIVIIYPDRLCCNCCGTIHEGGHIISPPPLSIIYTFACSADNEIGRNPPWPNSVVHGVIRWKHKHVGTGSQHGFIGFPLSWSDTSVDLVDGARRPMALPAKPGRACCLTMNCV